MSLTGTGDPEQVLQRAMCLDSHVPIRIVYMLFDGLGDKEFNRPQLKELLDGFMDEQRPPEMAAAIDDLLSDLDVVFTEAESQTSEEFNSKIMMECQA